MIRSDAKDFVIEVHRQTESLPIIYREYFLRELVDLPSKLILLWVYPDETLNPPSCYPKIRLDGLSGNTPIERKKQSNTKCKGWAREIVVNSMAL